MQSCDDAATDFPLSYMFYIQDIATGEIRELTSSPLVGNSEYSAKMESGKLSHRVVSESRYQPFPHTLDRKSTRLNSSHPVISYAVFCLKKKKTNIIINHI